MASNFIDSYKSSSNNLISALNEAVKLLEMKTELFKIELSILDEVKDLKHNDSVKAVSLYKKQMDVLRLIEQTMSSMNTYIANSIMDLISMLEDAFANPSLVSKITICQNQIDSISNFISKEYLKESIKLEPLKQTLLFFMITHSKKRSLPQYEKILNQIMEIYDVASRSGDEAM